MRSVARTRSSAPETWLIARIASARLLFKQGKEERAVVELRQALGQEALDEEIVTAGACFHFPPGTVHRVTALEDTTILEVSTPHLDDVVRLEDRYGREGTSDA